jgi:PhnB protein
MTKLHTYLNFDGKTEAAFTFYRSVFGGEFSHFVRFGEMPMEGFEPGSDEKERIMHVSLPIGDTSVLMGSDTLPSMGQSLRQGNNFYVSIHPDSKAEADRLFAGLSAGGKVEMPMADQSWGDYYGSFCDQFGVNWMINYSYQK